MAATEAQGSGPWGSARTAEPVLESLSGRSGAPTRYRQAVATAATAATAAAVYATITSAYRSSCLGSGQCLASRLIAPLWRCEE